MKLLLFAIQKTTSFEKTLAQRFTQSAYIEEVEMRFFCMKYIFIFCAVRNFHLPWLKMPLLGTMKKKN